MATRKEFRLDLFIEWLREHYCDRLFSCLHCPIFKKCFDFSHEPLCDTEYAEDFKRAIIDEFSTDVGEVVDKAMPSAQPKQRWIPCSERLPNDDNDYLVMDVEGNCAVGYYRRDAKAWDSYCFGWLENREEPPYGIETVIAWMPLPQPYTESEDKE